MATVRAMRGLEYLYLSYKVYQNRRIGMWSIQFHAFFVHISQLETETFRECTWSNKN